MYTTCIHFFYVCTCRYKTAYYLTMIKNGEKYLITTDAWFYGTDGNSYRAVWGVCHVSEFKEHFSFAPQRPSTNWMLTVGEGEKQVTIGGCQIHYAVRCDNKPTERTRSLSDTIADKELTPNHIFYTE